MVFPVACFPQQDVTMTLANVIGKHTHIVETTNFVELYAMYLMQNLFVCIFLFHVNKLGVLSRRQCR